MEETTEGPARPPDQTTNRSGAVWQPLWFLAHLAVVYIVVNSVTPSLAGWTRHKLLPFLEIANTYSSNHEFLYSHLFAFSFVPALLAGLSNLRLKHRVGEYVWVVPAVVLAYKLATFSVTTSVLAGNSPSAFHQYFGGGFIIPEYSDWREFWDIVRTNPDMRRGLAQFQFTAPFYAGIGYSVSAWVSLRTNAGARISEIVTNWEKERFGDRTADSAEKTDD